MNFSNKLPAALLGTIIMISQVQVALAVTRTDIENGAKAIAVKINRPRSVGSGWVTEGSGAIIAVDDRTDTYYVLTAQHVVRQVTEYQIQTPDDKVYTINYSNIATLEGVDLAVLWFTSTDKNYPVATIGDSSRLLENMFIYVFGWPKPGTDPKFIVGRIINPQYTPQIVTDSSGGPPIGVDSLDGGYSIAYRTEQPTEPGMSGGPIFDENGHLVGIHRRAPLWPGSLGIPSQIILQRVPEGLRNLMLVGADSADG